MIRGNLRIPKWLGWLFKPFVIGNYWDEVETDFASNLIEEGYYDTAEITLDICEKEYGVSTETIRLRTRIDRIRILGE